MPDRALHAPKRVHVLDLGLRSEFARADRANRNVGIAAQGAFFHLDVADAERDEGAFERLEIGDRLHGAANVRFRDALHQRDAGAVEVDERMRAAAETPVGGAGVDRLPRILFEVDARQPNLALRPVRQPKLDHSTERERRLVLRDLIVLGHVRIEVVLAIELRKRRDVRVEGEPGLDDSLDRETIGNRQRARIAETDRTDVRVRLAAEDVAASAEHLGLGLELDVALDADNRLIRHAFDLQHRIARGRRHAHRTASSAGGECFSAWRVPRSYAWATPRSARSAKSGVVNSRPSGSGFALPEGVT